MSFTRQQYSADYYSGANITISMGPCILTQAFGIQCDKRQNVTPIYGYNSQHWDSLTKGNVIVHGNLYLNFVSPRYLTVTIHRFHQVMNSWRQMQNENQNDIVEYFRAVPEASNLYSAIHRFLDIPTDIFPLDTNESPNQTGLSPYEVLLNEADSMVSPEQVFQPNQHQPTFGALLDDFFASDAAITGIQRILWGGAGDLLSNHSTNPRRLPQGANMERQYSMSHMARQNRHVMDMPSSNIGPDRLGHPLDGTHGIDITITYGNPFESQVTNTTFQYDHSTSRIIKGVRFYGENFTIMANSEPVIETYPFLARNIYSLVATETIRQS